MILKILGTILFIETLAFMLVVVVAIIYGESTSPFLLPAAVTALLSVIFYFLSGRADDSVVGTKEGYLSVTLAWLLISFAGAFPFLLSGTVSSFTDAFFESASGFTTTGATIFSDVESLPHSILFWRSLTHWIGGIGIIVLVILILPAFKIINYQLFSLESSGAEKIHPKTRSIGFRLLFIYLGLTVTEVVLLWAGDMNLFESICHSLGTVSTGSFSTRNDSLASFSSYSQYIVMIFMFLSGISFVIFYYFFKLRFKSIKYNDEFWFYFGTVVLAATVLTSILIAKTHKPFESAFREGVFQSVSFLTTTGYTNSNYLLWPSTAQIIIFLLLFTGASTGSPSGGIKMGRHLIILKNIRNVFVKILHPNAVYQIRYNNQYLSWNANVTVISFIVLYLFIFLISSGILTFTGTDPVTAASMAAASFGNIGPALGNIGPFNHYSAIPDLSKWILSLLMILGRLEIFTIVLLFTRSFWKK
ncbi:MAG: TrkH family potassium uptake protein [Bacteroidales bacterium]